MDQPNKDKKKKANGTPVAGTTNHDEEVRRTFEQKRVDKKVLDQSSTKEGKDAMAKKGIAIDDNGQASAMQKQKKFVKGDRTKGTYDAIYTANGKLVKMATSKDRPGDLEKEYNRMKAHSESSRDKTAQVHNFQTTQANNEARDRALKDQQAGEKAKEGMKKPKKFNKKY